MNRTVGNRNKLTVHVVQKWDDELTSPFSVNIREEKKITISKEIK